MLGQSAGARGDFMLRGISLRNFKGFGDEAQTWTMGQLTCLCGPNASGKSSVIQALLALRQTIEASLEGQGIPALATEGDVVSLGGFGDLLFAHDLSRELTLAVDLLPDDTDIASKIELRFRHPKRLINTDAWGGAFEHGLAEPALASITIRSHRVGCQERPLYTLTLPIDEGDQLGGWGLDAEGTVALDPTLGLGDVRLDCCEVEFRGFRFGAGSYAVWPSEWGQLDQDIDERLTEDQVLVAEPDYLPMADLDDVLANPSASNIVGYANSVLIAFARELTRINYIGPQREVPQRFYTQAETRARRMPFFVQSEGWRDILARGHYFHFEGSRESRNLLPPGVHADLQPDRLDLLLYEWLHYLGLPEVVPTLEGRDLRLLARSSNPADCLVSLTDTGYGVSQVLPILVQGLVLDGGTLILDQPELHLHPRLQTGMADFVLTVARENGSVIVETHSDHFINRVVRRVVEGAFSKEDVVIHFFTPTADGPHVEEIEIDPAFGIRNWPLGFFDQYADEQEAVIRASLKRRAEEGRQ
jgi:energy-coupling factor transporter ATP-binding protein EcfA2